MPSGGTEADAQLTGVTDPAALLEYAWAMEPGLRLASRAVALDRLAAVLAGGDAPAAPSGRDWALELRAEQAIDAAADNRVAEGMSIADEVLAQADPEKEIAIARAMLARGRALGWMGTDAATDAAERDLIDAEERFRRLGHAGWHAFAIYWRGNTVHFQNGRLRKAAELMARAIDVFPPESPQRTTVLTYYVDVLLELGDLDGAEAAAAEATAAASLDGEPRSRSYAAWVRAHLAVAQHDPRAAERLLREAERDATEWFSTHAGIYFLADAAERLDRLGLTTEAAGYLDRARELDARLRAPERPSDEAVELAHATVTARSGDPGEGLDLVQRLARNDWLEKRLVWRNTLLTAWATFRASGPGTGPGSPGVVAALALAQADACGGRGVAGAGEPEITAALAPLAQRVGSPHARDLLLAGRPLLVRLFGPVTVLRADGDEIEVPPGKPGELVRMLATQPAGLPAEQVLDAFFPDAEPAAARHRLRQVLTRLRATAGDLVVRDGEMLRLLPAWVDAIEFIAAADRVRRARGPLAARLAYGALALHDGPLLPGDPYAPWAEDLRSQIEYRRLTLLDLVAAEASGRGSHQEALTALDAAVAADPGDRARYDRVAEQLMSLGRERTAEYLARRAGRR